MFYLGSYYEDYVHTRVLKFGARAKRRMSLRCPLKLSLDLLDLGSYFVYFFGPAFEYVWTKINSSLPYKGLADFIQHAETAVEKVLVVG